MLRWHLQQGRSAIPKSVRPARILENFQIFDFDLSDEDVAAIDALEHGGTWRPGPRGNHVGAVGLSHPRSMNVLPDGA